MAARALNDALRDAAATEEDIEQLRTELHAAMDQVCAKVDQLRTVVRAEVDQLRSEVRGELGQLRAEMRAAEARTARRIRSGVVTAIVAIAAITAVMLPLLAVGG